MPPSPRTPRHSRHSSVADSLPDSQSARRLSKSSGAGLQREDTLDLNAHGAGGFSSNGMGNLADELADAFSDSGDEEYESNDPAERSQTHGSSTPIPSQPNDAVSGPSPPHKGHMRNDSQFGDSYYGSDTDLDKSGFPPSLQAKIDAVESLTRHGNESDGGLDQGVFGRVTDSLRDLGSQSVVEGGASRLITAHTALTTHLAHQTRQLHGLTFALLSPLAPTPEPEVIDDLVPALVSLSESMPRPSTAAYTTLTALHSITADLILTLNYLSDNLHMFRQTTVTATRRLKSARELLVEMRREDELREEGESWITRGKWGERLQRRECAGVCSDVIGGFEEVCQGWRERLLSQAETQA